MRCLSILLLAQVLIATPACVSTQTSAGAEEPPPAAQVLALDEPSSSVMDDPSSSVMDEPSSSVMDDPSCATATLGLDLRALPAGTGPAGVDAFVLGQGDALRALAGDPPLRLGHIPGVGVLMLTFAASPSEAALARCEGVIARYLERAPRLPVTMDPAASLTEACHACPSAVAP
jgi:hypothetical protein